MWWSRTILNNWYETVTFKMIKMCIFHRLPFCATAVDIEHCPWIWEMTTKMEREREKGREAIWHQWTNMKSFHCNSNEFDKEFNLLCFKILCETSFAVFYRFAVCASFVLLEISNEPFVNSFWSSHQLPSQNNSLLFLIHILPAHTVSQAINVFTEEMIGDWIKSRRN